MAFMYYFIFILVNINEQCLIQLYDNWFFLFLLNIFPFIYCDPTFNIIEIHVNKFTLLLQSSANVSHILYTVNWLHVDALIKLKDHDIHEKSMSITKDDMFTFYNSVYKICIKIHTLYYKWWNFVLQLDCKLEIDFLILICTHCCQSDAVSSH